MIGLRRDLPSTAIIFHEMVHVYQGRYSSLMSHYVGKEVPWQPRFAGDSVDNFLSECFAEYLCARHAPEPGRRHIYAMAVERLITLRAAEATPPVRYREAETRMLATIFNERTLGSPADFLAWRDLVRHLKDRGLGVLITDHNVRVTLNTTDRSYIMFDGRIQLSGTAEELAGNPLARQYYLGEGFTL